MIPASSLCELFKKKPKNKFGAIRSSRNETTFHSRAEARYYDLLKARKLGGDLSFFLMQVPLHLPGKTKYIVDFVLFYPDGKVEFVEVKGKMTDLAKLKIKQAEELYPIKITIVKASDLK